MWAIFGPAVGWSFIGTGLYAWRRRPESRIGALMILLGFAWFLFTLQAANSPLVYTVGLVTGSLWGAIFLQLGLSFPTGRLTTGLDRTLAIAGYFVFPLAFVPALLFSGPHELDCDDCPTNLLLVRRDADVAAVLTGLGALLLPRPLRRRARVGGAALARHAADRPPPAHAGLHLLAAHLPARDRGQGGRGRRGAVAGVHLDPPDAVRLPRAACCARHLSLLDAELRASLAGAARLARADRGGRRRRAPAPGARPARRRAIAPGGAQAAAELGAQARRRPRRSSRCSPRRSTSSTRASPSCASWPAASTRRSSPTTASSRRCRRSRNGRRCR